MCVVQAANGDILLSSYYALQDTSGSNYYVSLIHRLSSDGGVLWSKKIGSSNGELLIRRIREMPDGDIAVVGVIGTGSADAALLRFTPDGDLVLARRYSSAGAIALEDIAALNDSTMLVAGHCSGQDHGPLTVTMSNDGTIIQATIMAYPDLGGSYRHIIRCADGGLLLVGIGNGDISVNGPTPFDLMIAKFNSSGTLDWATRMERMITWGSEILHLPEGSEIQGQGFRIVAVHNHFVPFGHGFVMAALSQEGELTWSKKFTPSFSFPVRASINVNDTTLAVTGGYLQGNVVSIIGSSGIHLGSYVTHPEASSYSATRTSDGMIVTAGLTNSTFSAQASAPIVIKDEFIPTMCSVGGVAMAQDTFGLVPYHDHMMIPLAVATFDYGPDLIITDEGVVGTTQCISTIVSSAEPPLVSAWMADNKLMVTGSGIDRVTVFDISGRVVLIADPDGRRSAEFDLSGKASGVYAVTVQEGACIRTLKVLKQ
jgi:hypothetical protein